MNKENIRIDDELACGQFAELKPGEVRSL